VPFVNREVTVTTVGPDRWEVEEPLTYRGRLDSWTIPAGYLTDFATVPRVVVWLIPRFGLYTPAAILHDYLITDRLCRCATTCPNAVSPNDIDGLFRRVMRELGVSGPRRWVMWAGVRWGSLFGGRERGWWRTAPAVLGISVAVAPVVAPGVLGVTLGLAQWWLIEQVAYLARGRQGPRPRLAGSLRT
jgi:hypothetical protein